MVVCRWGEDRHDAVDSDDVQTDRSKVDARTEEDWCARLDSNQ
jgi:hypothetical protein